MGGRQCAHQREVAVPQRGQLLGHHRVGRFHQVAGVDAAAAEVVPGVVAHGRGEPDAVVERERARGHQRQQRQGAREPQGHDPY